MQNATIEERVVLLEIQVIEIEEDVSDLDQDVNFLFDEQVIQDERLFQLETESGEIQDDIVSKFQQEFRQNFSKDFREKSILSRLQDVPCTIVNQIKVRNGSVMLAVEPQLSQFLIFTDLQANTLDLEVRVGNLEENSGDDGNSSIAELEVRVETLEDDTSELELRVGILEEETADQEIRIVTAEENIQGEK